MKKQFDAVKRSAIGGTAAAFGMVANSAYAITTLPIPVSDMFITIQDYVNLAFGAAVPIIALSIGLGVLITLSKRFSKKV